MKKMIVAAAVAAMASGEAVALRTIVSQSDPIFEANVEALSNGEGGIYGSCEESHNDCIGQCPGCGQLIYAPGHMGPVSSLVGTYNH